MVLDGEKRSIHHLITNTISKFEYFSQHNLDTKCACNKKNITDVYNTNMFKIICATTSKTRILSTTKIISLKY